MYLGLPDPDWQVRCMDPAPAESGSFYHQAKIVRKTLIPTVLWLLFGLFMSEKWYLQKVISRKISSLLASWWSMTKIAGSGSISQRHGSADPYPDPDQNVMDLEHLNDWCFLVCLPTEWTWRTRSRCSGLTGSSTRWPPLTIPSSGSSSSQSQRYSTIVVQSLFRVPALV